MDTSISKPELETELGYKQLFVILLRRRFLFGSVFLCILFLSGAASLIMRPVFKSKMQLLVEPNYKDRVDLGNIERANLSKFDREVDYATQLTLLRSTQFLDRAVEQLKEKYPKIERSDLEGNFYLTQVVQDGINTRIYQGTFTDGNRQKTKDVLEAIQKVYQDYNSEQDSLRLKEGLFSIEKEIALVRDKLAKAETALKGFHQRYNPLDPKEQVSELSRTLNRITQERLTTRARLRELQASYGDLQSKLGISSQEAEIYSRLSGSPSYQVLLQELKNTETELTRESRRFTDSNPLIQNLLSKRQEILDRIATETTKLARSPYQSQENLASKGELGNNQIREFSQYLNSVTELEGLSAKQLALLENERRVSQEINRLSSLIGDYNSLEQEIDIQEQSLVRLLEQQQQLSLELSRGGFKWQIVEPPQIGYKIAPSLRNNLAIGLVLGLFFGGLSAFIRESLDDTVHSYEELQQRVSGPLLGTIPDLSRIGGISIVELLDRLEFRESLDLIYKNIRIVTAAGRIKSLLVTSAKVGEGKSTMALGLAISAARQHQRVAIVDSDLRHPSLHQQLDLANEYGLSTYLSGQSVLPKLQEISLSGLKIDVLTAGPETKDPISLLSSQIMQELVNSLKDDYDLVIFDCPPILGMADTLEIGSFCDGAVLVARIDKVTKTELDRATSTLRKLNATGIVVNGSEKPKDPRDNPPEILIPRQQETPRKISI